MNQQAESSRRTGDFYRLGGTLPANAPSYVTRRADRDLLALLAAGRFCYLLTSRQMGKSSLMVHTASVLRQSGTAVAVLDLTKIGQNLTPAQWYDGLLIRLGQEFDLEDELDDFWTSKDGATSKMGPMQRWMAAIRQVILPAISSNIVIFVDEIDAVRGLPFSTDEFFAGIREMYNSRTADPSLNRITFCLLGVAKPSDLIVNVHTTPFNIGHRIELSDFTAEEAQPLLLGMGREPAVSRLLLARALWWTGGHPYLTQRLCAAIATDETVTSRVGVDRLCEDLFLSSRAREKDDNLLFVRERVLRSEVDRAELLDQYRQVRAGKTVKDDDSSSLLDVLRLAGLVALRGDRLVVRNEIYARVFDKQWIRTNMPDAELRRQRAAFRKGLVYATVLASMVVATLLSMAILLLQQRHQTTMQRYAANMVQAQQDFDAGDFSGGLGLLTQWEDAMPAAQNTHGLSAFWRRTWKKTLGESIVPHFEWGYLWSRSSGESASAYLGHTDEVRSVAISPDGSLLATASADSTVRVFDMSTQPYKLVRALAITYGDKSGDTGADKGSFAYLPAGPDGAWSVNQEIVHLASGRALPGVLSVKFSPDGKWIAVGTGNWRTNLEPGTVYLWSTLSPEKVLHVPTRHTNAVDSVAFRSNTEFASTSEDETAEFWQLNSNETFSQTAPDFNASSYASSGMNAGAYSPDGRYFAMVFGDGEYQIKDTRGKGVVSHPATADVSGLMSVAFYDSNLLLLGSRDGNILEVDCRRPTEAVKIESTGQGLVTSLSISRGGLNDQDLLVTTGSTSVLRTWKLHRDEDRLHAFPLDTLRGHQGVVYAAAMTPNQSVLVSGGTDQTVRLWERQPQPAGGYTFAVQGNTLVEQGAVVALAYSPDGQTLASLRGESRLASARMEPTTVSFTDLAKNQTTSRKGHLRAGLAMAYSADSRFLATSGLDGSVLLWDTKTLTSAPLQMPAPTVENGKTIPRQISALSFSPQGDLVGAEQQGALYVWRPAQSLALLKRIPPPNANSALSALAFSPSGSVLAVCGSDNTVQLWNREKLLDATPAPFSKLGAKEDAQPLEGTCSSVTFSPDGQWLAAGTSFREIALWKAVSGRSERGWERINGGSVAADGDSTSVYLPLPPPAAAAIKSVAFSRDSRLLAYASVDGRIQLWDIGSQQPLPTLAIHRGGVLTIAFSRNDQCLASGSYDFTRRISCAWRADTIKARREAIKPGATQAEKDNWVSLN